MAKVLVAILTNGKPEKLERCLKSVNSNSSPHERIVVINTTDADFSSLATQLSFDNGFPVTKTKSNGTPGKGKNSVLRYFLASDADYLLQIDGDDYISETCIARLHEEIENNTFDVACLSKGYALASSKRKILVKDIHNLPKVARQGMTWEKEDLEYWHQYLEFIASHTFNNDPFNRYMLLNRTAAKYKFDETLDIAEDLLHFLQVKRDLVLHEICASEDDFLYMYDFSEDGQVMHSMKSKKMIDNFKAMMVEWNNG